jgi:hypothetical protein
MGNYIITEKEKEALVEYYKIKRQEVLKAMEPLKAELEEINTRLKTLESKKEKNKSEKISGKSKTVATKKAKKTEKITKKPNYNLREIALAVFENSTQFFTVKDVLYTAAEKGLIKAEEAESLKTSMAYILKNLAEVKSYKPDGKRDNLFGLVALFDEEGKPKLI